MQKAGVRGQKVETCGVGCAKRGPRFSLCARVASQWVPTPCCVFRLVPGEMPADRLPVVVL